MTKAQIKNIQNPDIYMSVMSTPTGDFPRIEGHGVLDKHAVFTGISGKPVPFLSSR
jgi:hypothetical protein